MKKNCSFSIRIILDLFYLILLFSVFSFSQSDNPYSQRRLSIKTQIGSTVAVIPSEIKVQSGYRSSKNYYYLTGRTEQKAVLVINPVEGEKDLIFTLTQQNETYDSVSDIKIRPFAQFKSFMNPILYNKDTLFLPLGDIVVLTDLFGNNNIFSAINVLKNIDPVINEMRLFKSKYELEKLQEAIDITEKCLIEALRATNSGMREIDLEAILQYTVTRLNGNSAFTQVASGPNSTFIHFGATERKLIPGDVIVFDFGAYYDNYVADISRTIPVSGHFTPAQKEIYNLVLKAQKAGIERMKPWSSYVQCEDYVEDVLIDGLYQLGLVTDTSINWQRKLYIMHGFSHGIGLDVHDVYQYFQKKPENEKLYLPGMIYTMEPGLYFPKGMLDSIPSHIKDLVQENEFRSYVSKVFDIYRKYSDIGVRIEDDVLITEKGNRVLSTKVPREIEAIEKLMKERSFHDLFRK